MQVSPLSGVAGAVADSGGCRPPLTPRPPLPLPQLLPLPRPTSTIYPPSMASIRSAHGAVVDSSARRLVDGAREVIRGAAGGR